MIAIIVTNVVVKLGTVSGTHENDILLQSKIKIRRSTVEQEPLDIQSVIPFNV